MSAVVSTVALNVQSDGSVAVKIDVVPSSRAPSPLLEMLGGAAAEATNLALAFVDDAAEATSAVASAGAALADTAETLRHFAILYAMVCHFLIVAVPFER